MNLSNVFLLQFPNFSLSFSVLFSGSNYYRYTTIVHFRLHIHCISMPKLLYFNFYSASFCTTFLCAGITTSISVHIFSFLVLIIISGHCLCVLLDSTTLWRHPLHTLAWACVCTSCLSFQYLRLWIFSNANVHKLYRVSLLLVLLLLLFGYVNWQTVTVVLQELTSSIIRV